MSELRSTSVSVVSAPISTPPSEVSRMPLSSPIPERSTTYFGRLMRSLNQSRLSLPPATAQPSLPNLPSRSTAPLTVSGWYSSNAGIMSLDIVAAPYAGARRRLGPAQVLAGARGGHHRVQVIVVRAAAAQVARQRVPRLVARRLRVRLEQRDRRHDLARGAEAALRAELVDHRLLHRMQLAVRPLEAFDRHDRATAH